MRSRLSVALPSALDAPLDWSGLHVSGHSQGSGHAYLIAKTLGVRYACLLGGPYDGPDSVNPDGVSIADWFKTSEMETQPASIGGFVVVGDPGYKGITEAYKFIGLTKGVSWFDATGIPEAKAHAASVKDASLKPQRAAACFRSL